MVDWPDQPSLPPGLPSGYVTPPSFGDYASMAGPFTSQQIEALRVMFQEALMQIIVLAVNGFFNAGEKAFDQLSSWATQLQTAAFTAADQIADMLDSLLGTGHTISDLVDYVQGVATDAESAVSQILALITGLGGDVMADVVEVITMIRDAIATFIGLVTGASDIGDVAAAINGATSSITSIFSNFGTAFPKAFPFTFGASTNLVLSPPVALSEFQQLLDGIAQQADASVAQAVGALQANVAAVQSNVSQAIVDGVNAVNTEATAIASVVNAVTSTATEAGVAGQGLIEGVNNAAAGVAAGASQLLADAQANLLLMLGAAPHYLQGLAGIFGQTATNDAYAAAAAARAAQAAEQARITSAFNAVFNVSPTTTGNVSQTIDFALLANAATMTGVMSPGTTHMGITSGAAAQQAGATSGVFDAEVFPTQTVTDYQVITATLGPLNDLASGQAVTYLIGRVNSARDTYIYAVIQPTGISLVAVVSGVATTFAAVSVPTLSTGGTIKMILGDPSSSSPYAMQVLYNGTPVITYTDSSHVSQLGASYRYVGLQMYSLAAGVKYPPAIRTVNYQDNPPAPTSYPHSGRPTAGTKGRLWAPTDVGLIQRDNSTAWETIWAGSLKNLTDPPSTSWSWVNQGTASTATEYGGERVTAPTSTRNWRMRVRTLTPSSNYTAAAYVEATGATATQWLAGIILRDSASGSFITFGPAWSATAILGVYRWTNSTTVSATSIQQTGYQLVGGSVPQWLRIRDDGSNRYFDYSHNGVDWTTAFSEGRTAFITPNQFGIGISNEASGSDCVFRLRSLTGIS
jgi:hypothetical protein